MGLDAAHVRWWAFDGPDDVASGLCLCAIHHKLFDKGVLGLTAAHTITVSAKFVGRSRSSQDMVLSLSGHPARKPQPGLDEVDEAHINWHSRQVFRPRPAADRLVALCLFGRGSQSGTSLCILLHSCAKVDSRSIFHANSTPVYRGYISHCISMSSALRSI